MADDLMTRARAGDAEAFAALTEPHSRELLAHCYRLLGSVQDAEDALQDTMLSAWQGLAGFRGEASLRTWLYRVATNRCLNVIRAARRRPTKAWDIPGVDPPEPTRLGEAPWLGAFPDALLEGGTTPVGPEARYLQTESISLSFVTALQRLPPRQLAVLVLRDVLGFRAAEVAEMLDTTVASVNSALTRARSTLAARRAEGAAEPAPAAESGEERVLAARFVRAYESSDVPALVELFTDDVFVSMPPLPQEYVGRAAAARFFRALIGSGRRYTLVATRANGCPAFGSYVDGADGVRAASGLFVVQLSGGGISALTRFEPDVLPWFGLPPTLPPR